MKAKLLSSILQSKSLLKEQKLRNLQSYQSQVNLDTTLMLSVITFAKFQFLFEISLLSQWWQLFDHLMSIIPELRLKISKVELLEDPFFREYFELEIELRSGQVKQERMRQMEKWFINLSSQESPRFKQRRTNFYMLFPEVSLQLDWW